MAELSTKRSLLLSVRRLSSDPARSMQDARLTRTASWVVWVILTQRTACDLEECALSCMRVSSVHADEGREKLTLVADVDLFWLAWS